MNILSKSFKKTISDRETRKSTNIRQPCNIDNITKNRKRSWNNKLTQWTRAEFLKLLKTTD